MESVLALQRIVPWRYLLLKAHNPKNLHHMGGGKFGILEHVSDFLNIFDKRTKKQHCLSILWNPLGMFFLLRQVGCWEGIFVSSFHG